MASLKDVARLAGVSASTVSRVLNKSAYVEPKTSQLVIDAVKKLDYRPNILASGLKAGSSSLIGVVVPEVSGPTFVMLIQAISDYCHTFNYEVVVGSHHDNPVFEAELVDGMLRRNVDGVLISLVSDESQIAPVLRDTKVPIVAFDRVSRENAINSVVLDNTMAGYLAAEHLLSLCHTKIACITGLESISLSRERLKGFEDRLNSNGIELLRKNVVCGNFSYESGISAAEKIFSGRSSDWPTAIWVQNDLMAIGAMTYLRSINLRIPDDVSIIGMDDISYSSMMPTPLTTIKQPLISMAHSAFDMFMKHRNHEEDHQKSIVKFLPELVVRKTTSKAPK